MIINLRNNLNKFHKGAYFCTGSYTVEAAVTLPIYIMAIVFVMFFMRIITTQYGIGLAMREAAETVAAYGEAAKLTDSNETTAILTTTILLTDKKIKEKEVDTTFIQYGILGINFSDSEVDKDYIRLKANYRIKIPFAIFNKTYEVSDTVIARRWVGYDPDEDAWDGTYVYVAKNGSVYHIDRSCTYLNPSIRRVTAAELKAIRSSSGGIYKKCEVCGKEGLSGYYVTDYGDRYHSSVTCSGLKRTVSRVLYEEAIKKYGACSKCSK